jgi:hypothetical protein
MMSNLVSAVEKPRAISTEHRSKFTINAKPGAARERILEQASIADDDDASREIHSISIGAVVTAMLDKANIAAWR